MYSQDERPLSFTERGKIGVMCCVVFIQAWASTIHPLIRRSFGSRYYDRVCALGLLIFFAYGSGFGAEDIGLYYLAMFAWVFAVIVNHPRIKGQPSDRSSTYGGYPRICDWFGMSEDAAKSFGETLFVSAVGFLISFICPSMAVFVIIAGIMSSFDHTIAKCQLRNMADKIHKNERQNVRRRHDAVLYGKKVMDEVRRRYD